MATDPGRKHSEAAGTGSDDTLGGDHKSSQAVGARNDEEKQHMQHQHEPNQQRHRQQDENMAEPVGFWHPDLATTRMIVAKKWWRNVLYLCTFILAVLSIYWGGLFKAREHALRLKVAIVNFDDGLDAFVGPAVEAVFLEQTSLGFFSASPSDYDDDPMKVRDSVYNEKVWAAVIINANASSLLRQAVEVSNSSYDPLGTCQLVYSEARDQDTYANFIYPIMSQLATSASASVGASWTRTLLANSSLNDPVRLASVPQALSPAVGFSVYNLRPFYLPFATPAVSVGLIYLIIISFFSFSYFMPIHSLFKDAKKHPPLKKWQLMLYHWLSCVLTYFFLALSYSLVSLAFQIPFSNPPSPADEVHTMTNAYGKGSFVVYWMINFWGMWALGMACENVAMIVGMPWASMWLIFWVITNVTTSFYPLDLESRFYYWGYAWPLQNVVYASRTIIFDTHSRIGLNFGVLIAWAAVDTAFFPVASLIMEKRTAWQARRNGQ